MPRADEAADPRVRADKSGGPTPRGLGQGNHPSQDSIGKLVHPSVRPEPSVPSRWRAAKSSQDSLSVASLRLPDNALSGFQSPGLTSSHAVADGMAERWLASWPDVSPVPVPFPQAMTGRRLIRFESEYGQIKRNAPGGIRTPNPRFRSSKFRDSHNCLEACFLSGETGGSHSWQTISRDRNTTQKLRVSPPSDADGGTKW